MVRPIVESIDPDRSLRDVADLMGVVIPASAKYPERDFYRIVMMVVAITKGRESSKRSRSRSRNYDG